MLTAAWPAKGSACCGWALLRKASPGRSVRAAVAAAVAGGARWGARSGGQGARLSDPRAAHAAPSRSGLAAAHPPSPPGRDQGPLVRLRSPAAEARFASGWASSAGSRRRWNSGRLDQQRPSSSGRDGGPRQSAGSSEQESAGQADRPERHELYENPWTIPNFLSMARIGLAPVLGYLIVEEDFNIALGVFALAGITDLLDGFIARNWANQKSVLGSALDPLADKLLISILYVSLTCANLIPVPLTSIVILRDAALIAVAFYVRYKTLPPPRTLSKYFNPCYAPAQLKPTFISKVNTVVQLALVAASLAAPVFNYVDSMYLQTLWCITACTTTASAYSYYHYGRKIVQVLNKK
uniref:cardiolipin synthase (CMP-forming) n=1 Tax=Pogona vitticeps TaxID=103695 RepID=A0ABM5GNF3_9SAUR